MDVRTAALKMIPLIQNSSLPNINSEYGKDHLLEMVEKMNNGEITGEKAHRWLGWIQGCVCVGGAPLQEMKEINHTS